MRAPPTEPAGDIWLPGKDDIDDARRAVADRAHQKGDPIPRGALQPGAIEAAIQRARDGPFPPGMQPTLWLRLALLLRGLVNEHA